MPTHGYSYTVNCKLAQKQSQNEIDLNSIQDNTSRKRNTQILLHKNLQKLYGCSENKRLIFYMHNEDELSYKVQINAVQKLEKYKFII